MSSVTVRVAAVGDIERIAEIVRDGWEDIYNGYRAQLGDDIYDSIYTAPLEVKADKIGSIIKEGRVLVAELDGCVCGFASYLVEGSVGALKDNAVARSARGHGVAKALYEAVFDRLRAAGCTVVRVGTGLDEAHAPARRAYIKAGFTAKLESVTYYKKL